MNLQRKRHEAVSTARERRYPRWLLALATLVIAGCSTEASQSPPTPTGVPVQAAEVIYKPVELKTVHTGRIEAAERVELRPRVSGYVDAVLYREGGVVKAGQKLFRIDSRPFEAALMRARAELARAEARANVAGSEAARAERLFALNAISGEERERRQATHAEAQAQAEAARAGVRMAELDLEFASVTAPVSGRAGRAMVTKGNFVAAGSQQAPLTTLTSVDPIHVYFDIGEGPLAALAATMGTRKPGWRVRVLGEDLQSELATGTVDFTDNEIARGSGTLRLRARLANPRGALLPGMFVRVELGTGERRQAILVDEKAIGTDQGQRHVLVVREDRLLEYRPVKVGAMVEGLRVIEAGLKPGESIVVNGLTRVRPGTLVAAQTVPMLGTARSPAPADLAGKSRASQNRPS